MKLFILVFLLGILVILGWFAYQQFFADTAVNNATQEDEPSSHTYIVIPGTNLSDEQIADIFALLEIERERFNADPERTWPEAKPLHEYAFQIHTEIESGEHTNKYVVSGFPLEYAEDERWMQDEIIVVLDGGSEFLNAVIDLKEGVVTQFATNGEA